MPGYEKNDDYTPAEDLALWKLHDEWLAENGFPDKVDWREIERRARRAGIRFPSPPRQRYLNLRKKFIYNYEDCVRYCACRTNKEKSKFKREQRLKYQKEKAANEAKKERRDRKRNRQAEEVEEAHGAAALNDSSESSDEDEDRGRHELGPFGSGNRLLETGCLTERAVREDLRMIFPYLRYAMFDLTLYDYLGAGRVSKKKFDELVEMEAASLGRRFEILAPKALGGRVRDEMEKLYRRFGRPFDRERGSGVRIANTTPNQPSSSAVLVDLTGDDREDLDADFGASMQDFGLDVDDSGYAMEPMNIVNNDDQEDPDASFGAYMQGIGLGQDDSGNAIVPPSATVEEPMNIVNNDDPEDANASFDVFMQDIFWQDMDDSGNGIVPASNTAEIPMHDVTEGNSLQTTLNCSVTSEPPQMSATPQPPFLKLRSAPSTWTPSESFGIPSGYSAMCPGRKLTENEWKKFIDWERTSRYEKLGDLTADRWAAVAKKIGIATTKTGEEIMADFYSNAAPNLKHLDGHNNKPRTSLLLRDIDAYSCMVIFHSITEASIKGVESAVSVLVANFSLMEVPDSFGNWKDGFVHFIMNCSAKDLNTSEEQFKGVKQSVVSELLELLRK